MGDPVSRFVKIGLITFLILAFLSLWTGASSNSDNNRERVNLTEEEIAYLEANPVIRVSHDMDYPPFSFMDNGIPRGLMKDSNDLVSDILGVQFEYVYGYTWAELIELFKAGDIDVITSLLYTPERTEYMAFSRSVINQKYGIMVHEENLDINSVEDLAGKNIASIEGYFSIEIIESRFDDVKMHTFDNYIDTLEAVSNGTADAMYGNILTNMHWASHYGYENFRFIEDYFPDYVDAGQLRMATSKDNVLLLSCLNKAINAFTEEEKVSIASKYNLPGTVFYDSNQFTVAELDWLANNMEVTIAVPNNYMPFSHLDSRGNVTGMVKDVIDEIEQRLEVTIHIHPVQINDVEAFVDAEEVIAVGLVSQTPVRRQHLIFTEPVILTPLGMFSNSQYTYTEFQDLPEHKVVVTKNHASGEFLLDEFPNLDLTVVDTVADGIELIESGERAIFLNDLISTNYKINQGGYTNVKVVGYTNFNYSLSFALKPDDILFRDILNKTLTAIFVERGSEIQDKWLTVYDDNNERLYQAILLILAIVALVLVFRLRVGKKVKEELKKLSRVDELTGLYNRRAFNEVFPEVYDNIRRNGELFVFAMMDIDNFKKYNDIYQHKAGDEVLSRIGQIMTAYSKRGNDYAFRLGGEEFGLIISADSFDHAIQYFEMIRDEVRNCKIHHIGNPPYDVVTISTGVRAVNHDEILTMEDIYREADKALYKAKSTGKNKVVLYWDN